MSEVKHTGDDPIVSGELEDWTYSMDAACWVNRWDDSIRITSVQVNAVHAITDEMRKIDKPKLRRAEINNTLNTLAQAIHAKRKKDSK